MKKFIATLMGERFINLPADRMEMVNEGICAYLNGELVAYVDIGNLLDCRLEEVGK